MYSSSSRFINLRHCCNSRKTNALNWQLNKAFSNKIPSAKCAYSTETSNEPVIRNTRELNLANQIQQTSYKKTDLAQQNGEPFRTIKQIRPEYDEGDKEFKREPFNHRALRKMLPSRAERMPPEQDWPSVWPSARSFVPSAVPLPVRMGYIAKPYLYQPPTKYANLELIKIPNFLHLTPPAIERHCRAIKKFCTPWPPELTKEEDENLEKLKSHYPIEYSYSDYCHAGTNLRDPRARIVTVKVKLSALKLHGAAREKFIRLVGEDRYNSKSDVVTIVCDRCPVRKQNKEYADYLLTVLYKEANKVERWESEITRQDEFFAAWDGSESEKVVKKLNDHLKIDTESVQDFKQAWQALRNGEETQEKLNAYAESVTRLLGLRKSDTSPA